MTDMAQLLENLQAMSGGYTDADAKLLAAYTDAVRPVLCRMCGACDGRYPHGTQVSDIVRSVMYAEGYGQIDLGLATYEKSTGSVRCGECRACPVRCPNGVNVAERVRRADELFG